MVFGWTQDDGVTNDGPPHVIQAESDVIAPIRRFAPLPEPTDFDAFFRHYPASDFEQNVVNYEAFKDAIDPTVSVHFFRLARTLRDILFTYPSINFGADMIRQTLQEGETVCGCMI
jgi:hypothetical protein